MLYFFNVVMGSRKAQDPEGSEFASLDAARREALQTARDLAAEKLREGHAIDASWRIDVADGRGNVHATVAFEDAIFKRRRGKAKSGLITEEVQPRIRAERYHRAHAAFDETREIAVKITSMFDEIRNRVAQIS